MREMLKKKFERKLKQNSAFTLMEMLIAVAVMTVLLGISILAINDWKKNLKMTELDAYAKNIYLEVQHQLAAMETEGSLEHIYTNLVATTGTYYTEYNSHRLTQAPAGYDSAEFGDSYMDMFYFAKEDTLTKQFVPAISLANENGGGYLLEINPESGDVYSVFYWEADNEDVLAYLNTYGSDSIYKMLNDTSVLPNRSKEGRKNAQIGYYGGSITQTTTATNYKLDQRVELVNGEELYVKISYANRGRMLRYGNDGDTTKIDISVFIQGQDSGSEVWETFELKENGYIKNDEQQRIETGLLLDSLIEGKNFSRLYPDFIPGENLNISVTTRFRQGSIDITETSTSQSVNSMFASLTKELDLYTFALSNVRHLRNLDFEYYDESVSVPVEIVLNNEIDFNKGTYHFTKSVARSEDSLLRYEESATRPINEIKPIVNDSIFMSNTVGHTVKVKGNNFVIKNLVVEANGGNAGLFAQTKNVHFENIRLEDYTLKAQNATNVGALVGYMQGGSASHSGVYLMPYYTDESGVKQYYNQQEDTTYGNVMARRYATMSVTGGKNTGGLFGYIENSNIEHCFAAVEVNGGESEVVTNDHTRFDTIGGFVGCVKGTSIKNSYASGNVRQMSGVKVKIGGFIGKAEGITVTQVYASGNVYGAKTAGNIISGFVANTTNSAYDQCSAYGEVLDKNGNAEFKEEDNVHVAGMLSYISINFANSLTEGTCHFLNQLGYNTSSALSDANRLSQSYKKFTESEGAYTAASYPYDGNLLYKAFPFTAVTDNHYGNWPLAYFINTSLVYYEKYAGGDYGYYSVTTIEEIGANGEAEGTPEASEATNYIWVVDSLRDEACVEDGYALMSMYYLDNFDYVTYQVKDSKTSPWVQKHSGNLKISNNYQEEGHNSEYAVLLKQQGAMEFRAYDRPSNVDAYSTDYSVRDVRDVFTMSGMYLYQLPYELQCTERYDVYNFYDLLVVYDGYAKGNTGEGAQPVVGGKTLAEGERFFYCPHFAKAAVNPDLGASDSERLDNPDVIAVRSARQLNALGRMPYYWNTKGGLDEPMLYEQEVDIDFGTYTNYTKKYCGEKFNLLAFDQPYSNQPIGDWDGQKDGYGSFQNDYNGNYHKIIDYCVKSDKQYVGLFGEIYKSGGATRSQIQNVVMTVSNPNHQANYITESDVLKQNNAGYIIGTFLEDKAAEKYQGENRRRTGVGALVGSDYTIGRTDGKASVFTINNCASAGYKVQYHLNRTTGTQIQPLGIAIGGLVGYSRGNIAYSSVTNDVKFVVNEDYIGNYVGKYNTYTGVDAAVFIGGFTGSYYFGTTLYCYSGGTIDVDNGANDNCVMRMRIGGFCPGWLYAPGISTNESNEEVRYQNIYSYTDILTDVGDIRETRYNNAVTFKYVLPVVGRMVVEREEDRGWGGIFKSETYYKWSTAKTTGSATGVRVPAMSYYLQPVYQEHLDKVGSEVKEYFEKSGSDKPRTCESISYEHLSDMNWIMKNTNVGDGELTVQKADITEAYELKDMPYPFPAFVRNAEGKWIHYGDWPLN